MAGHRSELTTPGTSSKMMEKASASAADRVMLDLEDSAAPSEKVEARDTIVRAIDEFDWSGTRLSVRVNNPDHPNNHGDLITVVEGAGDELDAVTVPKVGRPADVSFVDTLLGQLEAKVGIDSPIGIDVLIEETRAMQHVDEIAAASDRIESLVFGPADYAASQGVTFGRIGLSGADEYPGDIWHYARNRIVVAARSNGLLAIDGPFGDFSDEAGYRTEAERARRLGFDGKWAIHPSQIDIANDVFSPTTAEIERAQAVVEAMDEGAAAGQGAVRLDGEMLDEASARSARNLLERARELGLLD